MKFRRTCALLALLLCACTARLPEPPPGQTGFQPPDKSTTFSRVEAVQAFEASAPTEYLLGAGDEITVQVAARPELSGAHTLGPDGQISVPVAGTVELAGRDREAAAARVKQALTPYYLDLYVTVAVTRYTSNRIIVLGRVENPGVVQFETNPTLIEVLSRAGGFPILRPEQVLTRCAVIRGDTILWIDLKSLLNGNTALNIRLQRGDTIYIPDAYDTTVYVLGAVNRPGVYRLTPKMSFLDALGQAGGPSIHASEGRMRVIRPAQNLDFTVDLADLLAPTPTLNVGLEEGDIVYVPYSWIADVGYVLDQLNPFATLFSVRQLATPAQ